MESHRAFKFSSRAERQYKLLSPAVQQGFSAKIRIVRAGRLTEKQFNKYLKDIPGSDGFKRIRVKWGKNKQWLIAFVDNSTPSAPVIIGTHFLKKKKGVLPVEEIEKAVRIREEYEAGK